HFDRYRDEPAVLRPPETADVSDRTDNAMTHEPNHPPTPERLTAYHDGELAPNDRAALDAWLTDHPEAVADLAPWRRVDAVWKDTRPDDPSEVAWNAVQDQIGKRLADPPRRTGIWWLAVGAAAALFVGLGWALWPTKAPQVVVNNPRIVETEEPFEVM